MSRKNKTTHQNYISELGIGLILFGMGLLLYKLFPDFKYFFQNIINWQLLIIILGTIRGINTKFKGNDWWIITSIGLFLWLAQLQIISYSFKNIILPIAMVVLGTKLVLGKNNSKNTQPTTEDNTAPKSDLPQLPITQMMQASDDAPKPYGQDNNNASPNNLAIENATSPNNQDTISLDTVFGSNKKIVISKNFKGGGVSSMFGSTDIILSHADILSSAKLECFCLCGEINIIVPSDFTVVNNVTSVLGSVDDNRNYWNEAQNSKNLYLQGQVIMGSINIKNF